MSSIDSNTQNKLIELTEKARDKTSLSTQRHLLPSIVFYRYADHLEDDLEIDIPEEVSWSNFTNFNTDLIEKLQDFYNALEEENETVNQTFNLEKLQNDETVTDKVLKQLITEMDWIELEEDKEKLSQNYSELIRKLFTQDRDTGHLTTSDNVSRLLTEIIETEENSTVHDPTCGIGETLRHTFNKSGSAEVTGQEINRDIAPFAETNLILSGAKPEIKVGDSLSNPQFTNGKELKKFDIVISDFPLSADWKKEALEEDPYNRFFWTEKLPRKDRGDYAFLLHQVAHMDSKGRGAAVVPLGMLFRKHESQFREALVEQDIIEAIVTLPKGVFNHTSIEGAVAVLNKDKPERKEGKVQFIDGSEIIDRSSKSWKESISEIKRLHSEMEENRVSRLVDVNEIRENSYNLNLALYIDTTEEKETEDLDELIEEVDKLAKEQQDQNQKMINKLEEIR